MMRAIAVAWTMLVFGCSTEPTTETGGSLPTQPLFPLTIGTRWTYDRVDSVEFTTDTLLNSFHSTVSFGVLADTVGGNGITWAVLDNTSDIVGGLISGHEYFANLVGGTWEWPVPAGAGGLGTGLPPSLFFPYPTTKGATSNFGITVVLSTDSTLTVPAGTFHCIVYAEERDRVFVAPGVGVVWKSLGPIIALDETGQLSLQYQTFYFLKSVDIH